MKFDRVTVSHRVRDPYTISVLLTLLPDIDNSFAAMQLFTTQSGVREL
jgi:hypothetical protein